MKSHYTYTLLLLSLQGTVIYYKSLKPTYWSLLATCFSLKYTFHINIFNPFILGKVLRVKNYSSFSKLIFSSIIIMPVSEGNCVPNTLVCHGDMA